MYPGSDDQTRRFDAPGGRDGYGSGAGYGTESHGIQGYGAQSPQGYGQDGYGPPVGPPAGYVDPAHETPRRPDRGLGKLAGSVLATALVAAISGALMAWIIAAVFERFGHVWANGGNTPLVYALYGAVAAVLAGLIWYLLVVGTPDPSGFFSWIIGLLIVAAVVLPLLITTPLVDGIAAAIVHLGIGLPIYTLTGTFTRAYRR